jgi:hypothetical protein
MLARVDPWPPRSSTQDDAHSALSSRCSRTAGGPPMEAASPKNSGGMPARCGRAHEGRDASIRHSALAAPRLRSGVPGLARGSDMVGNAVSSHTLKGPVGVGRRALRGPGNSPCLCAFCCRWSAVPERRLWLKRHGKRPMIASLRTHRGLVRDRMTASSHTSAPDDVPQPLRPALVTVVGAFGRGARPAARFAAGNWPC